MSNLNISLDMDRVQSSVQAAIRPAVEAALEKTEIAKVIAKALKEPLYQDDMYSMMRYGGRAPTTLLDQLIHSGIQEIAKQYVHAQLMEQRADIEDAFRKMMDGSTSRLVKSFGAAVEQALKEDWGFELDVKVSHTVAEKDRDDD